MENNFEQYEALLSNVSEVAEACLDMEGGAFFLSWVGELIQKLAAKGYCRSAHLTAEKLCEAVGVDLTWAEYDGLKPTEEQAWLNMFAQTLMGHVMTAVE